jgi:nitrogen fixation/metabolism regulation signal transduction histidine kinase
MALALAFAVGLTALAAGVAAAYSPEPWVVLASAGGVGLVAFVFVVGFVLAPARRVLQALTDGVRSFRDRDFSMRLAATRGDELGELVSFYNELGDALRQERMEIYQRELLLDTVLQGTPVAIVLTGPTERVVFANRAARELLARGERLEGRVLDEALAQGGAELREALQSGGDTLFTVGSGGQEETYRGVRRTFRLHTQVHTLRLVERLTPELRRREVEVWKKTIRVMSHELNNSLAPIRSLVRSARQVLGRPEHAHRMAEIFDTVEERANHLGEFLEGYARFARLPRPTKEDVGWDDFLTGLRRFCVFMLDGTLPAAPGRFDPSQMQQALINLLKNAYEAGSPEGEVRVSVHTTADGGVVVRVADRGRGMDEDVMRRALLPFYSSKPAGSGLGLALCNEILEAHGGRLLLESREGGGTVVSCWLPG